MRVWVLSRNNRPDASVGASSCLQRRFTLELTTQLEDTIVAVMECVHNLDGNYDQREINKVADVLRHLTADEFDELQSLTYDHLFPEGDDEAC